MSMTLTIGGATVTPGPGTPVLIDRLSLALDGHDELEFHAFAESLPGAYHPEQAVTLLDGATPLFSGWIFSRTPDGFGTGPGVIGYRCLGLSYRAALIAITASDGTGSMTFNLPSNDTSYAVTEAGLSIGTIISQVLAQHSTQLAAIGVSTDATTTTQLAALTVVSPDPVYVQGNSLYVQLQQILQQWYGSRYALRIDYALSGSTVVGLVRCHDTYALTAETITLDSEPAVLTSMSEDTSQSYTQVVLRGRDDVEPAWATLHDGTLIGEQVGGAGPGWTATQQGEWTWDDYAYPKNGYDQGAITALTSTVVTVHSDDPAVSWSTNYWDGIQGTIAVVNPIITGLGGFQEIRHITACSALTAGGTATITVDRPFTSTGYTRYQIVGYPIGLSQIWRKYLFTNTYVAQHLVEMFNFGVAFQIGMSNKSLVITPIAAIKYTSAGITQITQVPMQIVPFDGTNPGYVLMNNPVVQFTSSQAQLNAGGSSVVVPEDVIVMVPYSRGALTVTSPSAGGYSGSAYSLFGVQRTLYRDYPAWIDAGNTSNMQTLADNILATVSNATQEGSVQYLGKYAAALPGGSWPIALNIARAGGTTGYESMAAPVRSVTLDFPQQGATLWATTLGFSTRRQMYSGDRLYVHAMYQSGGFGDQLGEGTVGGGGPTFGGVTNAVAIEHAQPDFDPTTGMEQGRYRKPSERHKDFMAAQDRKKTDVAWNRYSQGQAKEEARQDRHDARPRLTSSLERDERARMHDLADADRRRDIAGQHGPDELERGNQEYRDRKRTDDMAMRTRGSDQAIVDAHQSAYGKHDPAQDIVDAHPGDYHADDDGDRMASND